MPFGQPFAKPGAPLVSTRARASCLSAFKTRLIGFAEMFQPARARHAFRHIGETAAGAHSFNPRARVMPFGETVSVGRVELCFNPRARVMPFGLYCPVGFCVSVSTRARASCLSAQRDNPIKGTLFQPARARHAFRPYIRRLWPGVVYSFNPRARVMPFG